MNEAINGRDGHGWIRKDVVPSAERLVGGDQQGATFVAGADELEENARFGLALLDIGQVIQDEQVKLVEFLDRGGELEILAAACSCCTRSVVRVNSTR